MSKPNATGQTQRLFKTAHCHRCLLQTGSSGKIYYCRDRLLWGSLKKSGWPRYALAASPEFVRPMSAMCPPCVPLVSALNPRGPRLQACVRHVTDSPQPFWPHPLPLSARCPALCPPWLRLPALSCLLSPMCPLNLSFTSGLCPLLACCGAPPWHHRLNSFAPFRNPQPTAFILTHQIRPPQAHPILEKLFGVYSCWYNFLNKLPRVSALACFGHVFFPLLFVQTIHMALDTKYCFLKKYKHHYNFVTDLHSPMYPCSRHYARTKLDVFFKFCWQSLTLVQTTVVPGVWMFLSRFNVCYFCFH